MEYLIQSDLARAVISTDGAQIYSFKRLDSDIEYMWQGDKAYWSGRNPILFPQVGNTFTKTQIFKGQEYHMGNHGIARHAEFALVKHDANKVEMVLKSDDKTKELYPYDFALQVVYTLAGDKLKIEYRITNESEEVMPFGFGLHPAFNCPLESDEKFEDYYLEFPLAEENNSIELELIKDHKLKLSRRIFEVFDTLMYKDLNSNSVALKSARHEIVVDFANFTYLAFWKKQDAPFFCIEPWYSHDDFTDNGTDFSRRDGIIELDAKQSFYTTYAISIKK